MADTYKYSGGNMSAGNPTLATKPDLKGTAMVPDSLMNSVGLYSKDDVENARFHGYSRFGRMLDPYGRLNDTREYLFFVKPDLHIGAVNYWSKGDSARNKVYDIGGFSDNFYEDNVRSVNGIKLNPQLDNNAYFSDLIERYPDVVKELQFSISGSKDPFSHLLSTSVSSSLQLPSATASTLETGSTVFGTHYEYLKDSESTDENIEFSLEFVDSKHMDVYQFFKAYTEYHNARKSGLVTPPTMDYYRYRRLHNTMGVYKFLVDEDMETIRYWAYFWGVFPVNNPRETFGDPAFQDGLTFSIDFKAAFMEDMDPRILSEFNELMSPLIKNKNNWIPVVRQNYYQDFDKYGYTHGYTANLDGFTSEQVARTDANGNTYYSAYQNGPVSRVDGTIPTAAFIDSRMMPNDKTKKYRLRWYAE